MAWTVNLVPWANTTQDTLRMQGDGVLAAQLTTESREVYMAVSDVDATVEQAKVAPGIPVRGTLKSGSTLVFASRISADAKEGSTRVFVVTVEYESVPIDPFQPEAAEESWDTQTVEEPVDQDIDGNLICNAADEVFDPPVVRAFDDWVMTRSRNIVNLNTAVWSPFRNAVNWDAPYRGFPAKTARVVRLSFQRRTHGNFAYWRMTYVVAFRSRIRKGQNGAIQELGWTDYKGNLGFRKKVPKSGGGYTYETILDAKRLPLTLPVPLSADGLSVVEKTAFNVREFRNAPGADLNLLDTLMG